jgi:nucleotide-binding universal stress UspA family protein
VNGYLVGYDVFGIQRYVFEPVRPLDIAGGSALLERFASEAKAIAAACGAETIYSAGGGGLFIVPDESTAERLPEDFRKTLEGLTKGSASAVSASVGLDADFRDARERLRRRLGDERLAQSIDRPSDVLLPSGTRPEEVCQACGLEIADRQSQVGRGADGEMERIGPRCHTRREEGRERRQATGIPETIRDLFPREEEDDARGPERLPRGAVLAALYLDGDGLGRRLGEIADPHELRCASTAVTDRVKHVLQSIRGNGGRDGATILAPVVGGDDMILFCDARRAAALLEDLWSALEQEVRLGGEPVRFSAAIVLSDPYLPLRLLFDEAKRGLERAKERSRKEATAHVELRTLLGRRLHGARGTSLAGAPLPRSQFWGGSPSFRTLVESVSTVGRAQRSGIAEDLSEPSVELRDLLLDERAARESGRGSDAVLRAVEEARSLGQACGAASHDLLGAALAVVPLWGDRQ